MGTAWGKITLGEVDPIAPPGCEITAWVALGEDIVLVPAEGAASDVAGFDTTGTTFVEAVALTAGATLGEVAL